MVSGCRNLFSVRFGKAANLPPPLLGSGRPLRIQQGSGLKARAVVTERFTNSPITRILLVVFFLNGEIIYGSQARAFSIIFICWCCCPKRGRLSPLAVRRLSSRSSCRKRNARRLPDWRLCSGNRLVRKLAPSLGPKSLLRSGPKPEPRHHPDLQTRHTNGDMQTALRKAERNQLLMRPFHPPLVLHRHCKASARMRRAIDKI